MIVEHTIVADHLGVACRLAILHHFVVAVYTVRQCLGLGGSQSCCLLGGLHSAFNTELTRCIVNFLCLGHNLLGQVLKCLVLCAQHNCLGSAAASCGNSNTADHNVIVLQVGSDSTQFEPVCTTSQAHYCTVLNCGAGVNDDGRLVGGESGLVNQIKVLVCRDGNL